MRLVLDVVAAILRWFWGIAVAAGEDVKRAQDARKDMHDRNERDPASILRDDDGFKRPDD